MIELPNVTLILIGAETSENVTALMRSQRGIRYAEVKLLPALPTYKDYNHFVLTLLYAYFDTSHCLLIQGDGFVWHPELWKDEFLEYDYIGATMWSGLVGNGGFSLRSNDFCQASASLDLNVRNEELMERLGVESSDVHNEDLFLCQRREDLETMGMRIAPVEIADQFAWELSDYRPTPLRAFGLHGKHTIERCQCLNILD